MRKCASAAASGARGKAADYFYSREARLDLLEIMAEVRAFGALETPIVEGVY